jgi:hypothetical protein
MKNYKIRPSAVLTLALGAVAIVFAEGAALAQAAPVGDLSGLRTTVTLSTQPGSFAAKLAANEVTPAKIVPGNFIARKGQLVFPITEGAIATSD